MATDTVEAIVAEMWATTRQNIHCSPYMLGTFAGRLQSAHDAEVGALRAELATFKQAMDDGYPPSFSARYFKRRAQDAESRLREAERDARRYRWLRNRSNSASGDTPTMYATSWAWHDEHDPGGCPLVLDADELDAAIDRAMEADNES